MPFDIVRVAFACCVLSPSVVTQGVVGYPEAGVLGNCPHPTPLGVNVVQSDAEARTQILVPAVFLPWGAGYITGLAVECEVLYPNAPVSYAQLSIAMGPPARGTLDTTFVNNITSARQVFHRVNSTIQYAGNSRRWTDIPFDTPYYYRGGEGVLVDITKVARPAPLQFASMLAAACPERFDLPRMVFSAGPAGSNAHRVQQATGSAMPIRLKFSFGGCTTMAVAGESGNINANTFPLGGRLSLTVYSPVNAVYVNSIGVGFSLSPIIHPSFLGRGYVYQVQANVGATWVQPTTVFQMPMDTNLIGANLGLQSLTFDPTLGTGSWANATSIVINP